MKHLFVTALSVVLLSSCNSLVNNETSRKEFVESCKQEFVNAAEVDVDEAIVEEYCACSADKILSKFDIIDLIKMNDTSSQVYRESQDLIKPCIDDFTTQLQEIEY